MHEYIFKHSEILPSVLFLSFGLIEPMLTFIFPLSCHIKISLQYNPETVHSSLTNLQGECVFTCI